MPKSLARSKEKFSRSASEKRPTNQWVIWHLGNDTSALNYTVARIRPIEDFIINPTPSTARNSYFAIDTNSLTRLQETDDDGEWRDVALSMFMRAGSMPSATAFLDEMDKKLSALIKTIEDVEGRVFNTDKADEHKNIVWRKLRTIQEKHLSIKNTKKPAIVDDGILFYMFQHSIEWAYLLLRRAKHREHALPRDLRFPTLILSQQTKTIRHLWVRVCVHCATALDIAQLLHPSFVNYEMRARSNVLAMYGLALGRLRRFSEAHRRLNEAHALLTHLGDQSSVLLGIIGLRRAEVYVTECCMAKELANVLSGMRSKRTACTDPDLDYCQKRQIFETTLKKLVSNRANKADSRLLILSMKRWLCEALKEVPNSGSKPDTFVERLRRVHMARFHDAWKCLDGAEKLLAGRTHSSRWWGRLYTQRLRCLAEVYDFSIKGNNCNEHFEGASFWLQRNSVAYLKSILTRGLVTCGDDVYSRTRLFHYFWRAASGLMTLPFHKPHEVDELVNTGREHLAKLKIMETELLKKLAANSVRVSHKRSLTHRFMKLTLSQINAFVKRHEQRCK